jgi:rubrerythrin
MKKCVFSLFLILVLIVILPAAASATKTLDNLQTAFNGESNANARYLAFAKQADKEGYLQAASLFRAAARAEEIHAQNHAVVIKQMGGTPQAKIETPDVKSTSENLVVAMKGEIYERDVMYPDFIKQARAERNTAALQTFNYAKTAETEHAKLYTNAKDNLAQMKTAGVKYYVCTICGFTTAKIDFEKCPSCFNPKEKYVAVS